MMLRVHYFTGTGNSWWAAKRIAGLADRDGMKIEISAVSGRKSAPVASPKRDDLVGFSYPTHGFCLPWRMLKFILAYPRGRARTFLVNNRAGLKFGRIFTPGISGIAVLLPMLILRLKGYRLAGTLPLDTPSNWVAVHPGLSPRAVDAIFTRRKGEVDAMWRKLAEHKHSFPLKFLLMIPVDILVSPISLAYIAFGRFLLTATYTTDAGCDGCGLCASQCPVGAIRMVQGKPRWTIRCESCMRCLNICPHRAVHGSWILMILFSWGLFWLTGFSGPLGFAWKAIHRFAGGWSDLLLYPAWWIMTMALSWLLCYSVALLNRWKPVAWILAVTTPMHFWRRYLAPGFKGKEKA